ncbi:hypothetical protein HY256_07255, partial [Candidatus Sumerlaeota bacterium]|nr:hypothetical protein [Candidatus Sumerlaeota bacterium]
DVARTIHDISQPGHNIRSNVHPYFAPMMKPLSYALQRLGVTAGVSAILLNSAAAALGLMATGLYLRLRGVARTDAVLAVCLMAGSATMVVQGSLPGTFIFSLLFIALGHCLLAWHVRAPDGGTLARVRWGRELIWHITGIMNYGITDSNAFMTWVCYGLAEKEKKRWIRSCLFAVGLIVIGFGLAKLAKSSTDLTLETRWMTNTEDRGGNMPHPFLHSASTSLAWSIVAPMPQHAETMDRRHWHITAFHHWFYTPPDWGLVIIWFGIAGAAIWAAVTDTDPAGRRLTMALIICLLFHIGLHCFYYVIGRACSAIAAIRYSWSLPCSRL